MRSILWVIGALWALQLLGDEGYYLTLLVDNRRLEYSSPGKLLRTMAKHPSDGSKNSDVGHAWIILEGPDENLEVGFSGEKGERAPTYMEGVSSLFEEEDPNPGRYFFDSLPDGFMQWGAGGHTPTAAVRFGITREQHERVKEYVAGYPASVYSLTQNNCVTFVVGAGKWAEVELHCRRELLLPKIFWTDASYQRLQFDCPALLEEEIQRLVDEKGGGDAKSRMRVMNRESFWERLDRTWKDFILLPSRTVRWLKTWGV